MKVKITGHGQLNGVVIIDKIIELDEQIANRLYSASKAEVLTSVMNVHYPGVQFDPNNIGVQNVEEKKDRTKEKDILKGAVVGGATASVLLGRNKKERKSTPKSNTEKTSDKYDFSDSLLSLLDLDISGDEETIKNNLDTIYIMLTSHKWAKKPVNDNVDEKNSITMNKVYEYYKLGIRNLKNRGIAEDTKKEYIKQARKIRLKKIGNQYIIWLVLFTMLTLFIMFGLISDAL